MMGGFTVIVLLFLALANQQKVAAFVPRPRVGLVCDHDFVIGFGFVLNGWIEDRRKNDIDSTSFSFHDARLTPTRRLSFVCFTGPKENQPAADPYYS